MAWLGKPRKERRRITLRLAKVALRGKPLTRRQRRLAMHRQWAVYMANWQKLREVA